ncbi:MAG: DUF1549 and DUF1553 domain-containing protein, partial [Phycisphaerae bacterium]|nr:DUF1549 and DUF1553 domain-containing protein [Phycisphaerae bacterium]
IAGGASYPTHWSFIAPVASEPPVVATGARANNAIDAFVLAAAGRHGLTPSPPASRSALIRRLSLDLTGLPPAPDAVQRFIADASPDAYERLVDELLASPHFGERWAQVWLDHARYADTRGYEADRRRTMWPYRDWVIRAFDADMPFDRFTVEQLAGDLLPGATDDQRLATAFHRNTMTNDEGGTDDEEFRVAAVIDRVNTTMQTWMGLSAGCAQCHAHKYDPLSHEEYYQLFAFFNQTADADRGDERPTLAVLDANDAATLARHRVERARIADEMNELLARVAYVDPVSEAEANAIATAEPSGPRARADRVWIDDEIPAGARPESPWPWSDAGGVAAGTRAVHQIGGGDRTVQSVFRHAATPLLVRGGDTLFVHVFLDPSDPPRQVMVQFHADNWEHRVYWGESIVPWGEEGTVSRHPAGALPPAGAWVRLEVEAAAVGFDALTGIDGWALTQHGGTVTWDRAGVRAAVTPDDRHLRSQRVWEHRVRDGLGVTAPTAIRAITTLADDQRTPEQRAEVRRHYLTRVCHLTAPLLRGPLGRAETLDRTIAGLEAAAVRVPVLEELPEASRRVTRVLERGSFLAPGAVVSPDVPAVFPPLPEGGPPDRLTLARWLVSPNNPLTARVHVNRIWEQLFGTGLVETTEDFGIQGALPSHPELLDWLAVRFVEDGWSTKRLLRLIVMSATYRQSSAVTETQRRRDPRNRRLTRGPRFRLPAETIRDQALALSGLLNRTRFGPPVFPPQPEGIWQVIYSNDRWTTDEDANRHRRAVYTFWRRTSAYPSMVTFDAPSREICLTRRIRTNTPLQALVTLNDPAFVEAANAMAQRIVREGGTDARARASYAFRLATARPPSEAELAAVLSLYLEESARLRVDETSAALLAGEDCPPRFRVVRAAWTVVSNVLLNLDEVLTKG